jgi:hypothetical protein
MKNYLYGIFLLGLFLPFTSCKPPEFSLHALTYSLVDKTGVSIYFDVPLDKDIHEVVLSLTTNLSQTPSFSVVLPDEYFPANLVPEVTYDTDLSDPYAGTKYGVFETAAGNYEFRIWAKPVGISLGGIFWGGGVDSWNFSVTNLDPSSDPTGQVTSWDNSVIPVQLAEDPDTPEYDIANISLLRSTPE